ncbi:MAG: response regulator [Rhodoferax sp.]|nr:response regulator [Rhodoferax sp.]
MTQPRTTAARILIVDDVAANRDLVATVVRHMGHHALEASDGLQALALVRSEQPDLVISDILMPTMDGLEFVSRIRADPALAATEVVFYTAHYREREAGNLAKICGVSQVLLKPCGPSDIIRVVRLALSRPAAPEPAQPPVLRRQATPLTAEQWSERLHVLESSNQRLAALTDLNLHMASERDARALLDTVCRGSRDLIGARYALLGVNGREAGDTLFASCGIDPERLQRLGWPRIEQGLPGEVRRQRTTRRIDNPGGDPVNIGLPAGYPAAHRLLIAPVASLEASYGWICLADKLGTDRFDAQDEHMLTMLAAQLGRIYESGMLYQTVQRDAERLQTEIRERRLAQQALHRSTVQLRALSRRVLETQEAERRRVAHELHDELGQSLTAIKIHLQSRQLGRAAEDDTAGDSHDASIQIVDHAIAQMRRIALGLRPSILDDLGLAPALRWLADETTTHSPLIVHFQGGQGHARIDPQCETVCFRIAQEALTNAVRHGGATRVVLQLRIDDDKVWLQVDDNGAGFDVDAAIQVASHGRSMGLLGMRERARLAGGELNIVSEPGHGTSVRLTCPLVIGETLS